MNTVFVDFSRCTGKMKPMHAVNNGPVGQNANVFREAGFPYCRNHDAAHSSMYGGEHGHDVLNIFPDFDADENDPANYDFRPTDRSVRDVYACGLEMFYRLGSKIEPREQYQTLPPADYAKYARICEHIIRHYCCGWADGMELPITYWEIWNEPDGYHVNPNPCWGGTFEEFLEFYGVVAKHLKECFPDKKIGGPAFTGIYGHRHYMDAFVRRAREENIPLDFLSWHGYRTEPSQYVEDVAYVEALLLEYGFRDTENILNEWNYVRGWGGEKNKYSIRSRMREKGMAFCAASMLTLQKTALDMLMYYDARPNCGFNGLFQPYSFEPLKPYYAFWQFNKLYELENEVASSSDIREIYVGAAKKDGRAAVQIAYYSEEDIPDREVKVTLNGLERRTKILGLLTDGDHENEKIFEWTVPPGEVELVLKLKLHSSLLFLLETQ